MKTPTGDPRPGFQEIPRHSEGWQDVTSNVVRANNRREALDPLITYGTGQAKQSHLQRSEGGVITGAGGIGSDE